MTATFVVSLDFELYWGVRDVLTLEAYRENLLGERVAVEALLDLFGRRGIRATWATVGALFCATKRELLAAMPARKPSYRDPKLSPWNDLASIGEDEASDPFHFARSLVERIARAPGQELATHTFGHYYCLEEGQTAEEFASDLDAAAKEFTAYGAPMQSIVFPRNQYNPRYRDVLRERGVRAYRSTGSHWVWRSGVSAEPRHRRALRLADAYLPLSGSHAHPIRPSSDGLCDVPASAFLRPWSSRLRSLDRVRLRRIVRAIDTAAERGTCYHLWWHPHNFGRHLRENMSFLETVLDRVEHHRKNGRMTSMTMADAATISP